MNKNTSSLPLLLLMATLAALAPLAIDAYLPAIPSIAGGFAAPIHDAEFSISLFLGGFCVGQLVGGPYSDHFGRRRGILTGLTLFAIGSAGAALSPSMEWFWAFRLLQAVGGGIVAVNPSAVVRDISVGEQSARYLSHIGLIMMLAPLLAPIMGAFILHLGGWQWIFLFLLVYCLLIALAISRRMPETRRVLEIPHQQPLFQRYGQVLSHPQAMGYLFSASLAMGAMFTFITASPSLYMDYFGISEAIYPLLFGANIIVMITANRLNVRLLSKHGPARLLWLGQACQLLAGSVLLTYVWLSSQPQLAAIVAMVMVCIGSQGLIMANATTGTIEFFPHNSGTATALLGASGFAAGSLTGSLVAALGDGTPIPMALVMLICYLVAPLLRMLLQRPHPL